MKIMLRAAMMALSIGTIGSAYANDSEGQSGQAITRLTEIPGVAAQAPQPVTTAQSDQAIRIYAPRSNRTTWLFPPIGKYLAE
jgi:hypothetical protein